MAYNLENVHDSVVKFWDNNDDFQGIVYIQQGNEDELNRIFSVKGDDVEITGILAIIADACDISLKELAMTCMAMYVNDETMEALHEITRELKHRNVGDKVRRHIKVDEDGNKEVEEVVENNAESQESKSQDDESPKCHAKSKEDAIAELLKLLLADDD